MDMIIRKDWISPDRAPHGRSLLERVLRARGLETEAERQAFLDCSLDSLADPFLLPDMEKAAGRLARAVRSGERVLIHGDYDADGLTATALLARLLQSFGTPYACIIPERLTDGYGISLAAVERQLAEQPAALLVTVDCGVSAAAEIAALTARGLETIVTDHHECPAELPAALAVVNPRRPGSLYPEPSLAGVGVAYKLAQALCQTLGCPGREQSGLDYVAVGTVADIMPLTGENRILTANGLALINARARAGLKALLEISGSNGRRVTAGTVGFTIAPRLNAAGRMGSARSALDLLLCDQPPEAARLAAGLEALNKERQALENEILNQAIAEIDARPDRPADAPIVVWREGWHPGVIGIVAARLVERYLSPVIVLAGASGIYQGSGRTAGSFNLLEAIASAAAYTIRYGGHRKAAGLTLAAGQLEDFCRQLARYGAAHPDPERLRPVIAADLTVTADELNLAAAHDLERLMPFGEGNREPLFIIHNLRILEIRPVGASGRAVRFQFQAAGPNSPNGSGAQTDPAGRENRIALAGSNGPKSPCFTGIRFGSDGAEALFSAGECVDVLFSLTVNSYNGRESCQLQVKDLRPHAPAVLPGRPPAGDDFRIIYRYLTERFGERPVLADLPLLGQYIGRDSGTGIDGRLLQSVLQVLADAGLVQMRPHGGERFFLRLRPAEGPRIRLQEIPSYRQLMASKGDLP